MALRILVVDDDLHIREVICFAVEKAGFTATMARDGAEALALFAQVPLDLIVLDIGMPEMDGLEVCKQIRRTSDVPILFLSARDDEIDRVLGLEIGGDDYVTKPFSPRELVARIKAILKRFKAPAVVTDERVSHYAHGRLVLDSLRHRAEFDGAALQLTALEFAIVKGLLARPRIVFTREQIINVAYGASIHVSDRTIDSHIRNIRAKFVSVGCGGVIDTVRGVGFRLGTCETAL